MEAIKFLGLLALIWLFVKGAAPVQFIKKVFKVENDSKPSGITGKLVQKFVNCALCSGFWIGMGYYWLSGHPSFVLMACLVSVCAEIFARIIDFIFDKVLNSLK